MNGVQLTLLHPADHLATAEALRERVRRRRPGLRVRLAAADQPSSADATDAAVPLSVVVPLAALPPVGAATGIVVAPLAGHRLLEAAAERRLREAGVWPGDPAVGVVLTGLDLTGLDLNGVPATAADDVAQRWSGQGWAAVRAAAPGGDGILAAVAALRRDGAARVAVARLDVVGDPLVGLPREVAAAAPLGSCEEVARAVLARFDAALPALSHVAA
ncbi:MAG: hypothetical protein ACTHOD_14155 [Motilibacteraceae bacterium]